MLHLCESDATAARQAVVLLALRCRAAEMAMQAVTALVEEGLLPTVSLVLDRTCAYAKRRRECFSLESAKEGLGLLLQRGWLQEEASRFYTFLRCSEGQVKVPSSQAAPRFSRQPSLPMLRPLWAELAKMKAEAEERHGAARLLALAL
ncbi:unnamed protein product [Cladocopium goreaui]|uniref:Uncharacterized protein n=1 Tax=Cladocopium goreaui TaxID=2562237 RepID=A0A9P1FFX7_9DINO|nr:unnamed protein product [Cladocopium goreaui]